MIDPSDTCDLFARAGFDEVFRTVSDSIQDRNKAAGVYWVWLVLRVAEGKNAE